MFLKYKVDIPVVPGKLVRKNRGGHTYIEYEYDRIYDPVKQYTYPKRASIGRVDPEDPTRMTPNENFLKYFPDAEIPEEIDRSDRSPYLNIGTYVVLHKLMKDFIRGIIEENQGGFENSRGKYVDRYDVYGTTVKRFLCEGDTKKRNFHIYYSDGKAYSEKQEIKQRIRRLKKYLDSCVGKECEPFGPEIGKYFHLNYEKDGKTLKLAEENTSAVEKELSLAGYFAIVSSDNMTAREAIELYKSRDASEKLFCSDKSYLGNKSMRVHSDEALSSKVFIQFIALILRSRIYTALKEKSEKMLKKPNYLTVPAALKELEKIVMIRQLDGVYRLDHAVTATQKIILDAFGLNEGNVRYQAKEIGNVLQNQ